MGRRKKASKPPPKRKIIEKLDTMFNCPFCNHERSCEVKLDRQRNTGLISCTVCLEDFQTSINYLSEAIDVYSEWIDACESANAWPQHAGLFPHCCIYVYTYLKLKCKGIVTLLRWMSSWSMEDIAETVNGIPILWSILLNEADWRKRLPKDIFCVRWMLDGMKKVLSKYSHLVRKKIR